MTTQCAHLLAGGCAPQRWRRSTAAAASRLRTVAIRSAWPIRFAQAAPQLLEGPLFGRALAGAVAQLGTAAGDADESVPRRRAAPADQPRARERPAEFPPFAKRALARAPSAAAPLHRTSSARTVPAAATRSPSLRPTATNGASPASDKASGAAHAPLAFSPTAPETLLERLVRRESAAGTPASRARTEPAGTSLRIEPPREPSTALHMSGAKGATRPNAGALALDRARAGAAYEIQDAPARAFASAPLATSSLRARILARAHGLDLATRSRAAGGPDAVVERDWSRSPLGPVAPAALLERLVSARAGVSPPRSAAPARTAQAAAPEPFAGRAATAPRDTSTAETRAHPTARPASYDQLRANRAVRRASHPGVRAAGPPRASVAADPHPSVASPAAPRPVFAPLAEAQSSPPFALARGSAAAPALADEDDLDLLSAKIERILIEQARRNGIDV